MPMRNFVELKNTVAKWLNRQDLTDHIPDFIALAESRVAKVLRTADCENLTTLSTTGGTATVDLPADYLEARGVTLVGGGGLVYLTPAALVETYPDGASGRPVHYTIIGRQLHFGPAPDAAYSIKLTYYAKAPALADDAPTNWLLSFYPELLLYAALIDAAPFLGDDQRIPVWGGLFDDALGRVQSADERARWGGGPLTINVG